MYGVLFSSPNDALYGCLLFESEAKAQLAVRGLWKLAGESGESNQSYASASEYDSIDQIFATRDEDFIHEFEKDDIFDNNTAWITIREKPKRVIIVNMDAVPEI